MLDGEDHGCRTVMVVNRHLATVTEGDEPLAKFRIHVLNRTPDTRLICRDAHPFANGLCGMARGVWIVVSEEAIEPFDIAQRRRRLDQLWPSGTAASSSTPSLAGQASSSACFTCKPVA